MQILMSAITTAVAGAMLSLVFYLFKLEAITTTNLLVAIGVILLGWLILISYFFGVSNRLSFGSFGVSSDISKSARQEVKRLEDLDLSKFVSLASSADSIPTTFFVDLEDEAEIERTKKKYESRWAKMTRNNQRVDPIPIISIGKGQADFVSDLTSLNNAINRLDQLCGGRIFRLCIVFSDDRHDDQFFCLVPWFFFHPERSQDANGDNNATVYPESEPAKELWKIIRRKQVTLPVLTEYKKKFFREKSAQVNFSQIDLNRKTIDAITEMLSDEMNFITITKRGEAFFSVNLISVMSEVFSAAVEKNRINKIEAGSAAKPPPNPFAYVVSYRKMDSSAHTP